MLCGQTAACLAFPPQHIHGVTGSHNCFSSLDAFPTPPQPESAIADLSEHERQLQARAAPQQPLYPHQHQLQFTGEGLS